MTVRQHLSNVYSAKLMIDGKWFSDLMDEMTGWQFDELLQRIVTYSETEIDERGFVIQKIKTVDPFEIELDNA